MSELQNVNVEIRKNGPLRVSCEQITIIDAEGQESVRENIVSFCRCGKSQKQPFCDGSHKEAEPFE